MKIPSRPVRLALASGAALLVVGAAGAGVALAPADGAASETSPRGGPVPASAPAQPLTGVDAEAGQPAAAEPAAAPEEAAPVGQREEGEGYEGPGTERLPHEQPAGEGSEGYEGPGTERVPHEQPTRGGREYEGPGTDRTAAPVYRTVTPSSWRIVVPKASVYAVPGDTDTKTGTISDRRADVAGTGRAATVGTAEWFEVKVPGATTGWVVGTELEQR